MSIANFCSSTFQRTRKILIFSISAHIFVYWKKFRFFDRLKWALTLARRKRKKTHTECCWETFILEKVLYYTGEISVFFYFLRCSIILRKKIVMKFSRIPNLWWGNHNTKKSYSLVGKNWYSEILILGEEKNTIFL